ncbi:MAG: hypothetical protein AAF385_11610, partial [Pseudomonadota bacterium]
MPNFRARTLRKHLRAAGLAEDHVARISDEIQDHLQDLREEALHNGMPEDLADIHAFRQLGTYEALAEASSAHPELLTFRHRHPAIYRLSRPAAMLLMAPFVPIAHALEHSEAISRWFYAAIFGCASTAATLLF